MQGPKPCVLPLDYAPIFQRNTFEVNLIIKRYQCQGKVVQKMPVERFYSALFYCSAMNGLRRNREDGLVREGTEKPHSFIYDL